MYSLHLEVPRRRREQLKVVIVKDGAQGLRSHWSGSVRSKIKKRKPEQMKPHIQPLLMLCRARRLFTQNLATTPIETCLFTHESSSKPILRGRLSAATSGFGPGEAAPTALYCAQYSSQASICRSASIAVDTISQVQGSSPFAYQRPERGDPTRGLQRSTGNMKLKDETFNAECIWWFYAKLRKPSSGNFFLRRGQSIIANV